MKADKCFSSQVKLDKFVINTNEKIIVTVIASPTLHRMVYRAKGAAISSLLGIASSLRSSQ
jgi:hypothetical protein